MFTVAHLIESHNAHLIVMERTGQVKPATADWYRSALSKLRDTAGQVNADDLRPRHLTGVDFTNHFVRALKSLYRWAAEEELVTRNPFTKLVTPACGERNRVLSRPEMTRLYRAAARPFRRLLFLLAHTLARPGELRALTWGQVRLDDRYLLLTEFKAKSRRKDGVKVRTIPLDRVAWRMLANMHRKARSTGPMDPVFLSGRTGRPLTPNAVRCSMRTARKKAGLSADGTGERVVCYTLRHTGATNATKAGVRDRVLADIMGHATTRTTARYQHLDAATLVDAIDRVRTRPRLPG